MSSSTVFFVCLSSLTVLDVANQKKRAAAEAADSLKLNHVKTLVSVQVRVSALDNDRQNVFFVNS